MTIQKIIGSQNDGQVLMQQKQNINQNYYMSASQKTLKDEFITEHKKNGVFERLYNGIKNAIGLGTGTKKVEEAIRRAEQGEISQEEAQKTIQKYRSSQAASEQAFGDTLSIGASGATFFWLRKLLKKEIATAVLNEKFYEKSNDKLDFAKKFNKKLVQLSKSKTKATLAIAAAAAWVGGITKYWGLKFNRVGSDEFKYSKKDFNGAKTPEDKKAYKMEKKYQKSERRKANFRNFISGALNGLMMPLTMIGGAFVGVPTYFAANSLNRYFIGSHEDDKSMKGYIDGFKNDGIAQAAVVAATAVPMIKKAQFHKVFDANLKKTVDKLKDKTLQKSNFEQTTAYQELDGILRNSKSITSITENPKLTIEEKIQALTKENLFAVKMKQISNDGSKLTTALRENCPPSRTIEEAQTAINTALGNGYQVKQLLGVGTVAETYLAKDKTGKDVCIKILKNGITKDKIVADKQKFINEIKNSGKPQEEINNLIRNVDDMSDGLLKELDLANEMNAAKNLAEFTKVANVVKPIEVKNGAYVMEKANGISLASLVELNSAKIYKEALQKGDAGLFAGELKGRVGTLIKGTKTKEEQIKIIDDYIKQVESRTPEFGDINLSKEDFKALIEEYQHVIVEQFNKVGKNGKVLHADIHPGNIFIDVNALRARQKGMLTDIKAHMGYRDSNKIFTLIDTGNVVSLDAEQAMRAINLTSYIKRGNVKDLSEYMLSGVEGAALGGHTKEEAVKLLSEDLKKIFFDSETRLNTVTNESFVEMASSIMRKHGMIPADTQMTLNKARQSAHNSLGELGDSLIYFYMKDLLNSNNKITGLAEFIGKISKDILLLENKRKQLIKIQENKNLKNLSIEQRLKHKNNPNMLKTNSEDYLTYELKQKMKFEEKMPEI